ncbi:MAG: hypothetical protein JKY09_07140 [Crocinitomicaceae bacterium]|nr:hypothetical protein [Crocinitomicaceae bacterium]
MEKDTIIEAGLNAIPYVGGSLATLYYGSKNEKRFERLEKFYSDLKEEFEKRPNNTSNLLEHNPEDLENIISDLHDKVEKETSEEKMKYLRNFFISTIETPIRNDFDERKTFLDILNGMSVLECQLLNFLSKQKDRIQIKNLTGANIYTLYGAVNKLISYGFLETRRGSFTMNGTQDENLDDLVFTSDYGNRFIDYIKMN